MTRSRTHRTRPLPRGLRATAGVLLAVALMSGAPSLLPAARKAPRDSSSRNSLPVLVSLVFHHSTRGVVDNALPRLQARGGRATLGLVVQELEHTVIAPDDISTVETPGGYGNVQPVSLGEPDGEGLYTGRKFIENAGMQMNDDAIRALVAAGWELAFHGVDHTPQTSLVEQVDGAGKLARAYAVGVAEIRRLVGDPDIPVRTNTLASNAWSPAVRQVAAGAFDWTEVRWAGGEMHVPVVYGSVQDTHGGFNSIAFKRDTYDGPEDLDQLVQLAATDPGAWLVIQLHDVVNDPAASPDPETAMTPAELDHLLAGLDALGARLVTFSEGAGMVGQNHTGNRLRNTRFGVHGFLAPPRRLPLDWLGYVGEGDERSGLTFGPDGGVRLSSPDTPARIAVSQRISPWLLRGRRFVLRGELDTAVFWSGGLTAGLTGPAGVATTEILPGESTFCLEVRTRDIEGDGTTNSFMELRATDFTGEVTVSALSLAPQKGRDGCR